MRVDNRKFVGELNLGGPDPLTHADIKDPEGNPYPWTTLPRFGEDLRAQISDFLAANPLPEKLNTPAVAAEKKPSEYQGIQAYTGAYVPVGSVPLRWRAYVTPNSENGSLDRVVLAPDLAGPVGDFLAGDEPIAASKRLQACDYKALGERWRSDWGANGTKRIRNQELLRLLAEQVGLRELPSLPGGEVARLDWLATVEGKELLSHLSTNSGIWGYLAELEIFPRPWFVTEAA